MNSESFPAQLLKELRSPGALGTLMIPGRKNLFGTAQLDDDDWEEPKFGAFYPSSATADVAVNRRQAASLLLPSMNMVFSVTVVPRSDSPEGVHFECMQWQYMRGLC